VKKRIRAEGKLSESKAQKNMKKMKKILAYIILTTFALGAATARADVNLTVAGTDLGPNFAGPCCSTVIRSANVNTSFPMAGGTASLSSFVVTCFRTFPGWIQNFYFYVLDLHNVPGGTNHCVRTLTHFGYPLGCWNNGNPAQVFSVRNWNWPQGYQVVQASAATLGTTLGTAGNLTVEFGAGCLPAGAVASPYGMLSIARPMTNYLEVIDNYTDPNTGQTTVSAYKVRAIVPYFAPIYYLPTELTDDGTGTPLPNFTYQGSLKGSTGAPVPDGLYDFASQLVDSDDPSVALNVGPTVTNLQVAVSNGLFTLQQPSDPSFFSDNPLWLSISVRPSGNGSIPSDPLTPLFPAVPLTPTPRATYATAAGVVTAISPDQAVLSLKGLTGDLDVQAGQGAFVGVTNNTIMISAGISSSDRNVKTDVAAIKPADILARLAALPIRSWRYTNETAEIHHLGPMAQDFKAAFELGNDDRTIAFVDAGGVALAAIQGLNQKVDERHRRIEEELYRRDANKEAEIQRLQQSVAELKAMLTRLTESKSQ
jgi:hypothetical protein